LYLFFRIFQVRVLTLEEILYYATVKDTKKIRTKAKGKFQISFLNKEQNKITWFKNKNTRTKNKNTRCKTNVIFLIYYVNICKHEYENNMIRLWCKIVPKTNVEQIEGNEGSYSYLYFYFPSSRKFPRRLLHVHQGSFLKTFLVESWLWVN